MFFLTLVEYVFSTSTDWSMLLTDCLCSDPGGTRGCVPRGDFKTCEWTVKRGRIKPMALLIQCYVMAQDHEPGTMIDMQDFTRALHILYSDLNEDFFRLLKTCSVPSKRSNTQGAMIDFPSWLLFWSQHLNDRYGHGKGLPS